MMELRFKYASHAHEWKMRELEVAAASVDTRSGRKHRESFGLALLDAAAGQEKELVRRFPCMRGDGPCDGW